LIITTLNARFTRRTECRNDPDLVSASIKCYTFTDQLWPL